MTRAMPMPPNDAGVPTVTGNPAQSVDVPVHCLPHGQGLDLPAYQSAGAAGLDLNAAIDADTPLEIIPGARALVATGIAIALPDGFEAQIRPRSGLAYKHGVSVLNSPGTIDADYRGEIKVLLVNLGDQPFTVSRGMRIAQMVIQPVVRATLVPVDALPSSERGSGGFGSSGGTQ